MILRFLITIPVFLICSNYLSYISSTKSVMANFNPVSTDPSENHEPIESEVVLRRSAWSFDLVNVALASFLLAMLIYKAHQIWFLNLYSDEASLYIASVGDGVALTVVAWIFRLFGWAPLRKNRVRLSQETLTVPGFLSTQTFQRESARVWIQQLSRNIFRCVVCDHQNSTQLYISRQSSEHLRRWIQKAPSTPTTPTPPPPL